MTSKDVMPEEVNNYETRDNVTGEIYHIGKDFCFISSEEIPRTRIFMHWQGLLHNTLHFDKLQKGMKIQFRVINHPTHGWRAIKAKVIE